MRIASEPIMYINIITVLISLKQKLPLGISCSTGQIQQVLIIESSKTQKKRHTIDYTRCQSSHTTDWNSRQDNDDAILTPVGITCKSTEVYEITRPILEFENNG